MIVTRVSKNRVLLAAAVGALLLSLGLVARFAAQRNSAAALALSMVPPPICKTSPGWENAREAAAPQTLHLTRGCFTAEFDREMPRAQGSTPLLLATLIQDWRQAHALIRGGTAVDVADYSGRTPLMVAAKHGSAETVRDLLASFANPNATDVGGRTALHYAILGAQPAAISVLLRATATSELRWPDGRELCGLALATRNWNVIRPVLEYFPVSDSWSAPAMTMLRTAVSADDEANGRWLLSKHQPQPTLEGHRVPLLAHAIVTGDTPLVKGLLKFGANPNTVVPIPCEKDFLAAIKSNYLRQYVEVDPGTTPLMLAAGLGDLELVQTLLAAGADRNRMTSHFKMLPLYFATRSSNYRVTQKLLGSGPSPEALRIEISLSSQHISVLKNGAPILSTACSTGREGFSTPLGAYVITDKDRDHRSTIYKVAMPYFMRLNCRDFGLHEGNVGSPHASHGCIRLPSETARRLFSEIPIGTLVNIN